ncbi:response regulator transcription factor [Mitsuokella sp.]|uniref:response regulator transcription factor n=1 Tax=Mitsuokella sp. TaxID=2049034 RepID=UPI002A7F9559|nr:response regulator transcription factor [Mitsuokella sp.]MDY4475401.1 response regulator transcription factor [Mitsuokella sp.]
MGKRILVIDDERSILELVRMNLELAGYEVVTGESGQEALQLVASCRPDLLILDVMLPDQSGYYVLRHLREQGERLPVIMLTAKGEREDRILGLRLGADDYVTKPFSSEELILRVQAVLRRAEPVAAAVPAENAVAVQGLMIYPESRTAEVDGQAVSLTRKEFDTLELMMRHPNHVFTRERLLEEVWGYDFAGSTRAVDILIQRLRKKMGPYADRLETVYGTGYKLAERQES